MFSTFTRGAKKRHIRPVLRFSIIESADSIVAFAGVDTIPASATAGLILAGVWRELSRG
jgi:hypothetical protein